VRGRAIFLIIAGILLLLAGIAAWIFTTIQLDAQHITVPTNQYGGLMTLFSESRVHNPLAALAQAGVIGQHSLVATEGRSFAQIPLDDPIRETALTAAFLQASLYNSVLAFGLSLLTAFLGLLFIIVGSALLHLSQRFDGLGKALAGGYGGAGRLVGAPAEGVVLDPGVSYATSDYVVPTTEYPVGVNEYVTDTGSANSGNEYYDNRYNQ
jgi:hypothetical protein